MQNNDIEKLFLMVASEDEFILEIFLNGCISKAAANIFILEILTHMISLSKGFGEKYKPTELALHFVRKQNLS